PSGWRPRYKSSHANLFCDQDPGFRIGDAWFHVEQSVPAPARAFKLDVRGSSTGKDITCGYVGDVAGRTEQLVDRCDCACADDLLRRKLCALDLGGDHGCIGCAAQG